MVAAFVLLAAIIGGVFAGSAFFVIELIEYQLIDKRLTRVAGSWTSGSNSAAQLQASDLNIYVGQQIPPPLQQLTPGPPQRCVPRGVVPMTDREQSP